MNEGKKLWAAIGVGLAALVGSQALKAKQTIDDKAKGTSPEGRSFVRTLNAHLAYTRCVRVRGALTRPEMDPNGEPVPGWSKATETMPVLKNSPLEPVLAMCLQNEEYFKRFSNSIFCGWRVREVRSAPGQETYWHLQQTVYFKIPQEPQ